MEQIFSLAKGYVTSRMPKMKNEPRNPTGNKHMKSCSIFKKNLF
jgi:hypothetical protein